MRAAPAAPRPDVPRRSVTDPSVFLGPARDLAVAAGRKVLALLKDPLVRSRKADHSLVTNADHAANDLLREGLRSRFPEHALLSEETGLEGPADAPLRWLVDPLDGTRAYARGEPGFSVMIGLLHAGRPVLGVVYDPLADRLYDAARGHGAFLTEGGRRSPLRVTERWAWPEMPVITSTGFPAVLRERLATDPGLKFLDPINSVGIKVGYLVRGAADLYLNHHPVHYWDTAGPLAILEEAGGRMTHWDGSPLTYNGDDRYAHAPPTVASNGPRHADVVTLVRGALE